MEHDRHRYNRVQVIQPKFEEMGDLVKTLLSAQSSQKKKKKFVLPSSQATTKCWHSVRSLRSMASKADFFFPNFAAGAR